MIVEFKPKAKRNLVLTLNNRTINMHRGKYRTADKEEIKLLLNSPNYKSGHFEVVTPIELVNDYLSGKQPDKLTNNVLNSITPEGLIELANHLQLRNHGNLPNVIRVMAEGEYIDNKIEKIIADNKAEQPAENLVQEAKELGVFRKDGPWNKFDNPKTGKEETLGKSSAELARYTEQNKDLVREAIDNALLEEEEEYVME